MLLVRFGGSISFQRRGLDPQFWPKPDFSEKGPKGFKRPCSFWGTQVTQSELEGSGNSQTCYVRGYGSFYDVKFSIEIFLFFVIFCIPLGRSSASHTMARGRKMSNSWAYTSKIEIFQISWKWRIWANLGQLVRKSRQITVFCPKFYVYR